MVKCPRFQSSESMNQSKAFCPQCKNEVVFVTTGRVCTCPICGFQYELSEARLSAEPPARSGATGILGVLQRVFLIIILITVIMVIMVLITSAVVVTGWAVTFTGCGLGTKRW